MDAGTDASFDAGPAALRVFVSSQTFAFEMLPSRANAFCTASATEAGLGGSWAAWLSTVNAGELPGERAVDRIQGEGPWVLVDGTAVFDSSAQLRALPNVPISLDEFGNPCTLAGDTSVYTATATGGEPRLDCGNWLQAGIPVLTGDCSSLERWTDDATLGCEGHRIYCFEQR